MSVREKLKPVENHVTGIPSNIFLVLKGVGPHTPRKLLDPVRTAYDKQARLIEATLDGKDLEGFPIPSDKEELAAEMVAHMIIDHAFLHEALSRAGYPVGAYPFEDMADLILPRAKEENSNGNE